MKNAKKNIISETIKSIIPNFKPRLTIKVWLPSKVDSLTISRHQNHNKALKQTKLKNSSRELE